MKKSLLTLGAALTACLFMGQGVQAKTLEQILKEKGVITEAEFKEATAEAAKEAAKSKPIDYKLGKGFTFTSADEKFQLTLGGRMQFRYTFYDYYDNFAKKDYSAFDAKRIRIILQGYAYSKNLTYKLEIDPRVLATSSSAGGLLDAYLNYKIMDEVQVLLGQTKARNSRSYLQSDGALMFVDRAPFVTKLCHGYDIGALVYGQVAGGMLEYTLGYSNGDGQTNAVANNNNMFSTRVVFNPFGPMTSDEPDLDISKKPLLSIGANYLHNTTDYTYSAGTGITTSGSTAGYAATFTPSYAYNSEIVFNNYGVDAQFKWMGIALQGEALFVDGRNNTGSRVTRRALGIYGQAGYMITPELGLAVRYSYYDPNRDVANDLQTEVIGAVSYYFNKHNLKLQADIGNIHTQGGMKYVPYGTLSTIKVPTDDMQYRLQAQIIF